MATYKRGDKFKVEANGELSLREYVLASVSDSSVSLICIIDGARWTDPIVVKDPFSISEKEFEIITSSEKFIKISK